MQFMVASCMRNEALFLVEWIAHQKVCGFDKIVVATNDCTDGTDQICKEIAASDPDFIHVENIVGQGKSPQVCGMEKVLALQETKDVDYLLHCDSDEFLHLDAGIDGLEGLVEAAGNSDCIAILWRPYGDSGFKEWPGGLVTENFVMASSRPKPAINMHKSMFRPVMFERAIDHMPKAPRSDSVTLTNTKGEEMPISSFRKPNRARYRYTPGELFTWDNACLNHYSIRSQDMFIMKNFRGDGMGKEHQKYYINSAFWRRNNQNEVEVLPAQDQIEAVKSVAAELRAIGTVAELERQAQSKFEELRKELLTPEKIEEFTLSPE